MLAWGRTCAKPPIHVITDYCIIGTYSVSCSFCENTLFIIPHFAQARLRNWTCYRSAVKSVRKVYSGQIHNSNRYLPPSGPFLHIMAHIRTYVCYPAFGLAPTARKAKAEPICIDHIHSVSFSIIHIYTDNCKMQDFNNNVYAQMHGNQIKSIYQAIWHEYKTYPFPFLAVIWSMRPGR